MTSTSRRSAAVSTRRQSPRGPSAPRQSRSINRHNASEWAGGGALAQADNNSRDGSRKGRKDTETTHGAGTADSAALHSSQCNAAISRCRTALQPRSGRHPRRPAGCSGPARHRHRRAAGAGNAAGSGCPPGARRCRRPPARHLRESAARPGRCRRQAHRRSCSQPARPPAASHRRAAHRDVRDCVHCSGRSPRPAAGGTARAAWPHPARDWPPAGSTPRACPHDRGWRNGHRGWPPAAAWQTPDCAAQARSPLQSAGCARRRIPAFRPARVPDRQRRRQTPRPATTTPAPAPAPSSSCPCRGNCLPSYRIQYLGRKSPAYPLARCQSSLSLCNGHAVPAMTGALTPFARRVLSFPPSSPAQERSHVCIPSVPVAAGLCPAAVRLRKHPWPGSQRQRPLRRQPAGLGDRPAGQ
ncbi:hypothetical protein SMJ63A_190003 [Stenotrophomonas geniculata]